MNASEFRRWLKRQGCTFKTHKGGSGHLTVQRGAMTSQLPIHGGGKELGAGLVRKIKPASSVNSRMTSILSR